MGERFDDVEVDVTAGVVSDMDYVRLYLRGMARVAEAYGDRLPVMQVRGRYVLETYVVLVRDFNAAVQTSVLSVMRVDSDGMIVMMQGRDGGQ